MKLNKIIITINKIYHKIMKDKTNKIQTIVSIQIEPSNLIKSIYDFIIEIYKNNFENEN